MHSFISITNELETKEAHLQLGNEPQEPHDPSGKGFSPNTHPASKNSPSTRCLYLKQHGISKGPFISAAEITTTQSSQFNEDKKREGNRMDVLQSYSAGGTIKPPTRMPPPPQQSELQAEDSGPEEAKDAKNKKQTRRSDIQGLRTIAILAVMLFHLWPQWFPNGYLGVDMFFVISGYLMATILLPPPATTDDGISPAVVPYKHSSCLSHVESKKKYMLTGIGSTRPYPTSFPNTPPPSILAASTLSHFYRRRVQRILPMYLTTILATILMGSALLIDVDLTLLKWDAMRAIAFAYNMGGSKDDSHNPSQGGDYFSELSTSRFLTHTWSLSVEAQFYGIAPFLLWLTYQLGAGSIGPPNRCRLLKYSYLGCVLVASRMAQLLAPTSPAFHAMPCRLWQFFAGVLIHSLGAEPWDEGHRCWAKSLLERFNKLFPKWVQCYAALAGLAFILIEPLYLPPLAFAGQAGVVMLTALLLNCQVRPYVLTNGVCVELGDLSYLIYLAHWPLIQLSKYCFCVGQLGVRDGLCLFLICIGVAYLLDRTLDCSFRQVRHFRQLLVYLLILYAGCFAALATLFFSTGGDQNSVFSSRLFRPDGGDTPSSLHSSIDPLLLRVGEQVTATNYGRRFLSLMDNGTLSVGNLSMAEKISINTHFFNTSIEYYQHYGAVRLHHLGNGGLTVGELRHIIETNGSDWNYRVSFRGGGRLSVLLVGNSHADQVTNEVATLWKPLYSRLNTFTLALCPPFDVQFPSIAGFEEICSYYVEAVFVLIRQHKPDVVFLNFLWDTSGASDAPIQPGALPTDPITQQLRMGVERILSVVHPRTIVVVGLPNLLFTAAGATPGTSLAKEIARRQWFGLPLNDTTFDLRLDEHLARTRANRLRMAYAVNNARGCKLTHEGVNGRSSLGMSPASRCLLVDWAEAFCDLRERICRPYDAGTQLAYFIDAHHYSWLGCRRVRPIVRRVGDEVAAALLTTRSISAGQHSTMRESKASTSVK